MGASESKLTFKKKIFRLAEEHAIQASDPYWTGFWELPESVEDVFSLFSGADIRHTRDTQRENLETLLLALTSRLHVLRNHPSFPDPELAPERELLNCIRVLTRILPYIYEADHLSEWEEKFFWTTRRRKSRKSQISGEVLFDESHDDDRDEPEEIKDEYEDVKPLAQELIDDLIDLLFFSGFTIPDLPLAKTKVTYAIWQSGVGCKTSLGTSRELESNRCEVLRLLLTMTSKAMYMSANLLPVQGVQAVTHIATCPDKQIVLSVLCSLLNTTIKYNSASWKLPYDHVVWKDSKQALVVYSLQFLLVLLLYPVPEEGRGTAPKNFYRHFLGRLHRPEDFQFLAEGMTRVLSQPMQANTSYLLGSQKTVKWAPETIMLFWEVLQCNKRFRSYIIESNRAHDFVMFMIFYAIEHKTDPANQGIVRMCIFVLQTMSVEPAFGKNLNKRFEAQDTLPASIRLSNFKGTYADFLVVSIHTLITGSKGKLEAIYPALLAIINNIAAYAQNLSVATSSKLLQLFASMSSPSFLLANESNHTLLQSLLESINTILEHQYTSNGNLIYAVLKSKKRIEALRIFTLEGGQQELEDAARSRKKASLGVSPNFVTSPRQSITSDTNGSEGRGLSTSQNGASEEESTFTVGDSDESDDEIQQTPSQSSASARNSRTPSFASSSVEENVPLQLRGMSEKARGKLPAGANSFSRQSSTTSLSSPSVAGRHGFAATSQWLETWLPDLPLHTMLTIIKALGNKFPSATSSSTNTGQDDPSSRRSSLSIPNPSIKEFVSSLPATATHPSIQAILSSPSPIRVHLFEWSTLSLGWYMSILWSFIFTTEMTVAPSSTTANSLTGSSNAAGPAGVWNGTHVKLFQVATDGMKQGPSLSQPRGAVDAVGTKLVQGVQGLNLGGLVRGVAGGGPGGPLRRPSQQQQQQQRNQQDSSPGRGVREV